MKTPVNRSEDLFGLSGKNVVVVGSGPGFGRGCAEIFHRHGAHLITIDKDQRIAAETAAMVEGVSIQCDVINHADVQDCFRDISSQVGGIDAVINVVGMAEGSAISETSAEAWKHMMDLNLNQQFNVGQASLREMAQSRGGAIVQVASISGLNSAPGQAGYGAAKAGLISLMRSMAMEGASEGIRVNAVAPGPTLTPRIAALTAGETGQKISEQVPLGRMGDVLDICQPIVFLASKLARYITGQVVTIDGGLTTKFPLLPFRLPSPTDGG